MRTETELDVRPIGGNIGAEIHGVDVTTLSDDGIAAIRASWLEHLVVVIRDQDHISRSDLATFAAHFGEPYHHALMPERADPVHPINIPAGGYWHSDVTFAQTPPAATMLHALRLPPRGGDTIWANMYLAYETLSPAMRTFLDGLTAHHDFDHFYRYPMGDSLETDQFILDQKKLQPLPIHPVVREHPETGRKALFVNDSFTTHIEELSRAESDTILDLLHRHVDTTRTHMPAPLGRRRHRLLGQPLHDALPNRRLGRKPRLHPGVIATDEPHHHPGRTSALAVKSGAGSVVDKGGSQLVGDGDREPPLLDRHTDVPVGNENDAAQVPTVAQHSNLGTFLGEGEVREHPAAPTAVERPVAADDRQL